MQNSVTPVAIAVVRHKNRYLVGLRPEGVPLAGYAEFPGGKVRANETPSAAATRECREESGLEVEARGELLCTTHRYEHGLLEIHYFDCVPVNPAELPTAPFRWVEREELRNLNFPAANAPLTKLLLAS